MCTTGGGTEENANPAQTTAYWGVEKWFRGEGVEVMNANRAGNWMEIAAIMATLKGNLGSRQDRLPFSVVQIIRRNRSDPARERVETERDGLQAGLHRHPEFDTGGQTARPVHGGPHPVSPSALKKARSRNEFNAPRPPVGQ